ncbi:MAG: SRPBCC family protein [Proteobacteria bacterium]|nr:SRPBCC family protein [Pseudomonadota bacterium]
MSEMTITTAVDINSHATEAWDLFGEGFADWANWAPGIDASKLEGELAEGVVRVNETASLGTVRQTLARFNRESRALAYEMTSELPPLFSKLRNDWEIVDLGDGRCRLQGRALFQLTEQAEPMRDKLQGKMGMTLEVFANAFRDTVQAAHA